MAVHIMLELQVVETALECNLIMLYCDDVGTARIIIKNGYSLIT